FRLVIARPLLRRVLESSLRAVTVALAISFGVTLIAVPIYVDVATAEFSQRSAFDLGALLPLMRASAFGRGFLDLELAVALAALAAFASTRRVACMVVLVPRFSRVAFVSVIVLIASGTVASFIRLPTLQSLWNTGYGQALLVKIGLLLTALVLAAVNLLRTR